MIRRILILTLLSCYIVMPALAVDGVALDPSRTPFTARQLGMGGVSVAFSDDANGVFSNPAGMTEIEFPQLIGASRKLVLAETQYSLIGWAVPTDWGIFGMGYTGMNISGSLPTMLDPANNRIIIDPSREAMSYDNSVILLSYARKVKIPRVPNEVSIGGNLKFFNQSFSGGLSSKASATGLDLSATYQPLAWLTTGINLQNLLEGNLQWDGASSDKIGGFYKLGCKVNILGASEEALRTHEHKLYAGLDIDIPHSTLTGTNYHLGAEYFPLEKIALRGGFNMDQNGTGLTLGVGLINGGFRFDYAFVQRPGLPGDAPHYFSLSYIGERVVRVTRELSRKEPFIRFSRPKDRFITDQDTIVISAEALARRILDEKTSWIVTAISETSEVKEIAEIDEYLNPVYINGIKIEKIGSIETTSPLRMGRNAFEIIGYTTPEALVGSGEVRVLRFTPFVDTPLTYWAIEPIALSVTLGLVKGYPDDTFRPEKGITRAELVTLLVRSMPEEAEEVEFAPFIDVPFTHWAAKFIAYGSDKKLVTGYPDGTFKPNRVLTRAEGITILARYADLKEKEGTTQPFPDLKPDFWANKYIAPAKEAGMLKYLKGKDLEPSKPFPRSEACEVLYRTPQVKQRVDQFWETGLVSAQQPKAPLAPAVIQPETELATSEARP